MSESNDKVTPAASAIAVQPERLNGPTEVVVEKEPRTLLRLWAILIGIYLSLFLAALDANITATAIPTISARLHSGRGYVWIAAAYVLAEAAAGPIWMNVSNIWGRKPVLLAAIVWFAAASVFSASSVNITTLIAGRALQGVAAGGLEQLTLITISDIFSPRRRTLYLGLTEIIWAISGSMGPLIGGVFTQLASWRWCFYVNLPFAGIAFLLLLLFMDLHNPRTSFAAGIAAIDWFGTLSMLAMTLMLMLGLDFGGMVLPWSSPKIICLISFSTACVALFIFSEKKLARYPLMPLHIFRDYSNAAVFTIGVSQGACFFAAEYYLPLYFQSVRQASPVRSGLLILPITVSEASIGLFSSFLMYQSGRYRELIWTGLLLVTLSTGLYISFDVFTPLTRLIGFMLIGGIGNGTLFEAPIIAIQSTARQEDVALATSTYSFLRNVAKAVAIVIGGVIFQNRLATQRAALTAAGVDGGLVAKLTGSQAAANIDLIRTLPNDVQRYATQKAFASSLKGMWIFYTCVAVVGLLAGIFIRQRRLEEDHVETKTGIAHMSKRDADQKL